MVRWFTICMAASCMALAALTASPSSGADEFPLEGTYMQNRPCPADGSGPKRNRVVITAHDITYASGVCTIGDFRRDGRQLVLRATCRQRSGKVLASDIALTLREDNNLDMIDRDGSYKAVLHRCPEAPGKAGQPPGSAG